MFDETLVGNHADDRIYSDLTEGYYDSLNGLNPVRKRNVYYMFAWELAALDLISTYREEFVGDIPDDDHPVTDLDREWEGFNPEIHEF